MVILNGQNGISYPLTWYAAYEGEGYERSMEWAGNVLRIGKEFGPAK